MASKRTFADKVHTKWAARLGFPLDRLLEVGEDLAAGTRRRVLALGAEAVPSLLEILCSDDLVDVDSPGEGWAPAHAATLLADLGAEEAIGVMLERLRAVPIEAEVANGIHGALPRFGAAALEPVLAATATAAAEGGEPAVLGLLSVLSRLGVQDDRILALLTTTSDADTPFAAHAWLLGEYGDPRALPLLARLLDRVELPEDDDEALAGVGYEWAIDLGGAIRDLGGALTVRQQRTFARALELRRLFAVEEDESFGEPDWDDADLDDADDLDLEPPSALEPPIAFRAPRRTGEPPAGPPPPPLGARPARNEPCWCGSGRKYKRCHQDLDREADAWGPADLPT